VDFDTPTGSRRAEPSNRGHRPRESGSAQTLALRPRSLKAREDAFSNTLTLELGNFATSSLSPLSPAVEVSVTDTKTRRADEPGGMTVTNAGATTTVVHQHIRTDDACF